MHSMIAEEGSRGAQRPIASIVQRIFFGRVVWSEHGHVILGEYGSCRVSRRPRPQLEIFYGAWLGAAGACKVSGKFLFMKIDGSGDGAVRAKISAGHIYALHGFQN